MHNLAIFSVSNSPLQTIDPHNACVNFFKDRGIAFSFAMLTVDRVTLPALAVHSDYVELVELLCARHGQPGYLFVDNDGRVWRRDNEQETTFGDALIRVSTRDGVAEARWWMYLDMSEQFYVLA